MKVSDSRDSLLQVIQQYQRGEAVKAASEKGAQPPGALREERVDISEKAREFSDIKAALKDRPEVREEKVQALQDRIDQGRYRVPAEDLARKIVGENLLDLFA
ncbi:MAG TPA: flagellar biosynthesis anti-sigma factor FlgM [Syntrophales bacterium]|nr:flagellar biosynthesis anti-sigma factor FlgM [Syntrophales bacterium]HOM06879.1 flagellar biosynthesis anti-sigma factor FlgM [Syntrophales bacterium]HON99396.1 flagellar biosynthesis anti-sigma factor FlgM [Syntrophales bacterium]HPC00567.1 flagellar biosynthesis anti-sigma factor FlgM [Syntrophales bacterium]HPQ06420.1 flagellar biosynthesis anti-sigma factor FlgM [Syntrophales bacterium]